MVIQCGNSSGHKIFVSYKYADSNVYQLNDLYNPFRKQDTVRTYVDYLEDYLNNSYHIYKGESDNEDLSELSEDTIRDKLFTRIYDSTLTIVMISPGMKDDYKDQKDQWIPQEISYSLRNQSRKNSSGKTVTSSTNAMLAVVLPDYDGNYDYFVKQCTGCSKNCIDYNLDWLFPIMNDNSFNKKILDFTFCDEIDDIFYRGEPSYIKYVIWDDFEKDPEKYISIAYDIRNHIDDYNIHVQL